MFGDAGAAFFVGTGKYNSNPLSSRLRVKLGEMRKLSKCHYYYFFNLSAVNNNNNRRDTCAGARELIYILFFFLFSRISHTEFRSKNKLLPRTVCCIVLSI